MAQSPGLASQAANALGCEEVTSSPIAPGDSLGVGPGACVTCTSLPPHRGDTASLQGLEPSPTKEGIQTGGIPTTQRGEQLKTLSGRLCSAGTSCLQGFADRLAAPLNDSPQQ